MDNKPSVGSKFKALWKVIKDHKFVFITHLLVSVGAITLVPYFTDQPQLAVHLTFVSGMIFIAFIIRFTLWK